MTRIKEAAPGTSPGAENTRRGSGVAPMKGDNAETVGCTLTSAGDQQPFLNEYRNYTMRYALDSSR